MKKVLILSTVARQFYLFEKGNINLLKEMGCQIFAAANKKISNLDKVKELDIEYKCISIERNPFSLKNIKAYFQVKKIVEDNQIDLIHCHSPMGGVIGRVVGITTKVKVIYTAHGFHFFKGAPIINWVLYYAIEKILSKFTDIIITINEEDYAIAKKFFAKRVEYVPGIGIDVQKIKNLIIDKKIKRQEMKISNETILMSVGELSKRKNHIKVIEDLEKIKDRNFYYFICGEGKYREILEKKIKDLKLDNKIILLGYREDIYELLSISDIFLFPSIQEGLPVALMEAMASGVPTIVSNIRGNRDLIINGENGFLVENSVEKYTKKIELLLDNKELREKFKKESSRKILEFDISKVREVMRKIYMDI